MDKFKGIFNDAGDLFETIKVSLFPFSLSVFNIVNFILNIVNDDNFSMSKIF